MRTVCLIQARMSSVRLPGKVLADLAGQPLLAHVVQRVRQARTLDAVIVATGDLPANNPIEALCHAEGWPCVRGSESDVLDRFYQAAMAARADVIVRVSGDSPLIAANVIDLCVDAVKMDGVDYATNTLPPESWPDGLCCEAFKASALADAWREAKLPSDREHVTPFVRRQPGRYGFVSIQLVPSLAGLRLCVDEWRDFQAMRAIMDVLGPDCDWRAAVRLLEERPDLAAINQSIERNAAYLRQVKEEQATT